MRSATCAVVLMSPAKYWKVSFAVVAQPYIGRVESGLEKLGEFFVATAWCWPEGIY